MKERIKIMIPAKRFLLLTLTGFLLLMGMTLSAQAQRRRFPSDRQRYPTEVLRVTPVWSVSGTIRWKKEYGRVPAGPVSTDAAFVPCGQHFAAALKIVGQPGSFGRHVLVAYSPDIPNVMVSQDSGEYYVCSYRILNLPKNTNLTIMAGLGGVLLLPQVSNDPYYHTTAWVGGSQPKPPPGSERVFQGSRTVTLTDAAPRATVNFEMVYERTPQGPR